MPATNFIPPLRIEIRRKKSADTAAGAWSLLDTAQTQTQAEDKIKRNALPKEAETRIVKNMEKKEIFSSEAEEKPEPEAKAPAEAFAVGDVLRDTFTGAAVRVTELGGKYRSGKAREGFAWENLSANQGDWDHTGFCPAEAMGSYIKLSAAAVKAIEKLPKRSSEKPELKPEAKQAPLDAIVGETPLPFGVGDTLRDVHSGVAVRVTAINGAYKSGKPRPGFAWESLATKEGEAKDTGFCPLESVGCFAPVAKNAKVIVEPSHKETTAPAAKAPRAARPKKAKVSEKPAAAPAPESPKHPPAHKKTQHKAAGPHKAKAPHAAAKRSHKSSAP